MEQAIRGQIGQPAACMIESKVSSFRVMGQQRAIMAQCGTVLRAAAGHLRPRRFRLRAYSTKNPVDNFVGKQCSGMPATGNVNLV